MGILYHRMGTISDNKKSFFGHPRGLATLFFTEMWERFSYYGMRAILALFMTTSVAEQGLGFSYESSSAIYALYTASVYLLALPGGWLADNIIGKRKSVWYGGLFIMFGHLALAVPGSHLIFFLGLCLVSMGTGMLKPSVSTSVGDLYPEGGAKRDAGFSVYYMGINLGAFIGQIVVPALGENVNWHLGFGMAAIGMLAGLVQYRLTQGYLGDIGLAPEKQDGKKLSTSDMRKGVMFLVLLAVILSILQFVDIIDLTSATGITRTAGGLIAAVTVIYFIYILLTEKLTPVERKRVVVIFILFIGAALFWAGFEQAGSSLNFFARDHTDRHLFGMEMPAGAVQSVNSLFVILFAPIIGTLWIRLSSKNINPNTPIKFGIGLILMAAGFLVMVFASKLVLQGTKPGMGWLTLTYFLHSIGELVLSPIGLSAMTKLSPKHLAGQMMGIWFVGDALGSLIAGLFGGGLDPKLVNNLPNLFMSVVIMGAVSGALFILFSPVIKKWMGGVK